mgnify:CR=1 FL=1
MNLIVKEMNMDYANEILHWSYSPPYDFYNIEYNDEALQELLEGSYLAIVSKEGPLIGYFCTGKTAQVPIGSQFGAYPGGFLDIGIGMTPLMTGKGNGTMFFQFILDYLQSIDQTTPFRFTVAKFNQRAIRLYEKLGFERNCEFQRGTTSFATMIQKSSKKEKTLHS